jgi:cysteinyl-tRNA synthetase
MATTEAKQTAMGTGESLPSIEVYNTLTKKKTPLVTVKPGQVGMYLCGPTVYKPSHIGHMVGPVIFDTVKRYLEYSGWKVTWVVNITDIDDKIIAESAARGTTMAKLATEMTADYLENLAVLGVESIDEMPKATEHIGTIIAFIEGLIAKGYAYASDGDVYFDVTKDADYGKLTNRSIEATQGEGGSTAERKRSTADFALWKKAKAGEPSWESPWGPGRPGWHIECSAMSCDLLGEHFDLHGGGADLQFPHHENEIAQSEGANGNTFVNLWMHNGFVRINDEKMSKSLGNFFTIRDVLKVYDPEVVRFFMLRSHYRSDINYSDAHLDDARHALTRLYTALKDVPATPGATPDWNEPHGKHFRDAMNDDFNTPVAVSVLFELASEVNKTRSTELANQLSALSGVMGLLGRDPHVFLQSGVGADGLDAAAVEARIEERRAAKAARDFARADGIRADLLTAGIVLEDKPGGVTEWRRA